MCPINMYPIKLKSVYKDYIWGGTKLKEFWNKNSCFKYIAESWELSCCDAGLSFIENGILKDKTLRDVLLLFPKWVGENFESTKNFPLLIKLIDAKEKLSIQVHPSDELADKSKNQQGKTEAWYILDCEKDAFLYIGLKEALTENQIKEYVISGTLCEHLNKVFVKPGDIFFISSGTIHAIGSGIVIAEIQQNSNTTFRLFDYNRVDSNGNKRELHLEEALRVCDKTAFSLQNCDIKNLYQNEDTLIKSLVNSKFFKIFEYDIKSTVSITPTKRSFQALLFIEGLAKIYFNGKKYEAKKGDCYFIPAGMGEYKVTGTSKFLMSEI